MYSWDLLPFEETSLAVKVHLKLEDFLELHYSILDPHRLLNWPEVSDTPSRKIGLWQDTCLEFFSFNKRDLSYVEWNLSPSLDWNCFQFEAYRKPDILLEKEITKPEFISCSNTTSEDFKELKVRLPRTTETHINVCAVLRESTGRLHYFALQHNFEQQPDFHNSSLFLSL
ncbi:MAG: hypothetical protein NXH75_14310 [Halobacteriovoraceae bacterium]|nr:hypothetical protein [Halobacteriovoraceae bacterium]